MRQEQCWLVGVAHLRNKRANEKTRSARKGRTQDNKKPARSANQIAGYSYIEVIMTQTAEVIKFARPYVKADIDKGYDRLAHDLTNALMNPPVKLSAREIQIIMAVIAKTYRFHKRVDWIANTQLSEMTGIADNHISELKRQLVAKNVLLTEGRNTGINTVISDWSSIPKAGVKTPKNRSVKTSQKQEQNLPKTGTETPKYGSNTSQKQEPQKKETNTKETNTKEKVGAKRATRIPEKFSITPEMESWAKTKNFTFNLLAETENFILYWQGEGKTKVDWQATWKSWMNRTQQRIGSAGAHRKSASRARPENFSNKDYGNDLVRF